MTTHSSDSQDQKLLSTRFFLQTTSSVSIALRACPYRCGFMLMTQTFLAPLYLSLLKKGIFLQFLVNGICSSKRSSAVRFPTRVFVVLQSSILFPEKFPSFIPATLSTPYFTFI